MRTLTVTVGMLLCGVFCFGCKTADVFAGKAVDDFNTEKYLGTWYEIARLDFRFEKDLNNTTAEYSLVDAGRIRVVNRGFNYKTNEWKEAVGKAKFRSDTTKGALLVSFFGPFYGSYNIVALDKEYQYALVAGKDTRYLWILARSKDIPSSVKTEYLNIATELGYDVTKLIWVEHTK
jgi:apolipoprotein D and lipocalin family protein